MRAPKVGLPSTPRAHAHGHTCRHTHTPCRTLCRHRCAHCWPLRPGMCLATTDHLLPYLACARAQPRASRSRRASAEWGQRAGRWGNREGGGRGKAGGGCACLVPPHPTLAAQPRGAHTHHQPPRPERRRLVRLCRNVARTQPAPGRPPPHLVEAQELVLILQPRRAKLCVRTGEAPGTRRSAGRRGRSRAVPFSLPATTRWTFQLMTHTHTPCVCTAARATAGATPFAMRPAPYCAAALALPSSSSASAAAWFGISLPGASSGVHDGHDQATAGPGAGAEERRSAGWDARRAGCQGQRQRWRWRPVSRGGLPSPRSRAGMDGGLFQKSRWVNMCVGGWVGQVKR